MQVEAQNCTAVSCNNRMNHKQRIYTIVIFTHPYFSMAFFLCLGAGRTLARKPRPTTRKKSLKNANLDQLVRVPVPGIRWCWTAKLSCPPGCMDNFTFYQNKLIGMVLYFDYPVLSKYGLMSLLAPLIGSPDWKHFFSIRESTLIPVTFEVLATLQIKHLLLDICVVMEINGSDIYHESSNNIWSCGVMNIVEFGRDVFEILERCSRGVREVVREVDSRNLSRKSYVSNILCAAMSRWSHVSNFIHISL